MLPFLHCEPLVDAIRVPAVATVLAKVEPPREVYEATTVVLFAACRDRPRIRRVVTYPPRPRAALADCIANTAMAIATAVAAAAVAEHVVGVNSLLPHRPIEFYVRVEHTHVQPTHVAPREFLIARGAEV